MSLHPLKSLHAFGDAGIVTSKSKEIIDAVALDKNHGLTDRETCAAWSFNCRLDELQAALLRVQLGNLDEKIKARRHLAHRYHEALSPYVQVPVEKEGEFHSYQTYLVQAEQRDALQQHLRTSGIEAIVHYPRPLHLQPAASGLGYVEGSFPVAERLSHTILSLPIFPGMSSGQQDMVMQRVAEFYGESL